MQYVEFSSFCLYRHGKPLGPAGMLMLFVGFDGLDCQSTRMLIDSAVWLAVVGNQSPNQSVANCREPYIGSTSVTSRSFHERWCNDYPLKGVARESRKEGRIIRADQELGSWPLLEARDDLLTGNARELTRGLRQPKQQVVLG